MALGIAALPLQREATPWAAVMLALLALCVLLALPCWLVTLVPSQDGPVHLAQADLIARFGWGGALSDAAAGFYQWNPRVEPNSTIYVLLAGLARISGDPLRANTLFLSLYALIWVGAAYVAARAETDRSLLPTLLLLPVAFGIFIHWGFYNFALGIPLFLLFGAYWRSVGERRNALTLGLTALFILALTLTHVTTVVAACLLLAANGAERALGAWRRLDGRAALRQLFYDGCWAMLAALPSLLLVASFLTAYQGIEQPPAGYDGGLVQVVRRIMTASYLYSFSRWEVLALAPLLAAVVVTGLAAAKRFGSGKLLWPIFVLLVLAVSALNLRTGAALLSERLAPYSWIGLVLALASRQPGVRLARPACLAALVGLCGQTAMRVLAYRSWSPVLESTLAAGRAHPGASFANIETLATDGAPFSWRVRPSLHADQIAALAAGGVGLSATLPSTRYFGYFPLQYREDHDFMRVSKEWEAGLVENGAIASFRTRHAGAPSFLIVTGVTTLAPDRGRLLGYPDCASDLRANAVTVCAGSALNQLAEHAQ